jgi:hypothetical protein
MAIEDRIMYAVAGTVAARAARRATRRALHHPGGTPKLPRRVRERGGWGTALAWAVGTGIVLGLADVLTQQGRDAARR